MRRPKERSPVGSLGDQQPLIPFGFSVEVECLYDAMRASERLLATGRPYGLAVALSPALAAQMDMRHGDAAAGVLSNTRRIDLKTSPSRFGMALERLSHWRRVATYLGSVAVLVTVAGSGLAQQAQTLSGAPIQMQPFVTEPGAPTVTINPGTPNPFGALDGGDGSGSSGGSSGGGSSGDSDALSTLLGTSWGASAAANAQSIGVNSSALAGMCVAESGCNANVANNGSFVGAFQMGSAAFQDGLKTALAANPGLASQVVQGSAGMIDPTTEAIAASGYLLQANNALQSAGIANPTTLDARAYYNFGPTYGSAVAQSQPTATMASVLPASYLAPNGISPTETVAQWQASVSAKIGNASGQSIVNS